MTLSTTPPYVKFVFFLLSFLCVLQVYSELNVPFITESDSSLDLSCAHLSSQAVKTVGSGTDALDLFFISFHGQHFNSSISYFSLLMIVRQTLVKILGTRDMLIAYVSEEKVKAREAPSSSLVIYLKIKLCTSCLLSSSC